MTDKMKHPGRGGARRGVTNATSRARISRSSPSTKPIAFKAINNAALPVLPIILARWLPNGKRVGREYVALNPRRADQHIGSFKIAVAGPRIGMWADFATGDKGGDVISLAAYLFELAQRDAAQKIAGMLGVVS
jgi:hypothetical protein